MTMTAAGVGKLIEEIGELQEVLGKLQQTLGKKLAWWNTNEPHWDGSVLNECLQNEMGDVLAAIYFVVDRLGLDERAVDDRHLAKVALFETWQAEIDNNDHGIDGSTMPPGLAGALDHWRKHGFHRGLGDEFAYDPDASQRLKAAIDSWRRGGA